MPIYSFQCDQCETIFDVRASIQDKETGLKPRCPKCQAQDTRQVITAGLLMHDGLKSGRSITACAPNARPGCCR